MIATKGVEMTKPNKPIEAQGLGCGLVISLVIVTSALCWLGVPPGPSVIIAMFLAGGSLFGLHRESIQNAEDFRSRLRCTEQKSSA